MVDYLFPTARFDRYSGPNNHILDLCNYLYTKSNKSLALITHSGSAEPDFLREIKFPTIRILKRSARVRSNVKAIRNVIRRLSPRRILVNCDGNLAFQTYFATNARLLIGYNVFFGGRFSLDRYLFKWVYFRLRDRVSSRILVKRILAHTLFHRKLYMEKLGIEPDKITVIPHCVDLDRLYRGLKYGYKIEKNGTPVVLFVGRIAKYKGIIELLRAYEQISRKTDVRLLIVGSGPFEREVHEVVKQIERKNTKAHITCTGRVVISRLLCLMNSADIVAIPSYSEMSPIVTLEGMGLKKAVLATCFGGPSEVITNGVNGILVNPFDSQQLQSHLEELISDPIKRKKLGRSAYQTVNSKYDVSVVAPKFIDFLEGANIS